MLLTTPTKTSLGFTMTLEIAHHAGAQNIPSDLVQLEYVHGTLRVDGVSLNSIVTSIPTPFYCYSAETIRSSFETLSAALDPVNVSVCFAVKANGNLSVLRLLANLGCGMDIVSGGELERVLAAGVVAAKVIFSGVGKTKAEIAQALRAGIYQFNVESEAELDAIVQVARAVGMRATVALRLNPDVDARTHVKISTGRKEDKFGIAISEILALYAKAAAVHELDLVGLAVHIGSQILDFSPYRAAYSRIAEVVRSLRSEGHLVRRLDLGGGIGIRYDQGQVPDVRDYAEIIRETVGALGCELTVEPGRWLVGRAGVLVTEILYVKRTADRLTVVVDAGMNDLMRPAMYGAVHPVLPLEGPSVPSTNLYQIAGPVCESSDIFGTYQGLPQLIPGDRLAFACVGAYGASMSSTYNARDLVAEVLVDQGRFRVIRQRQTTQDLLVLEQETEWNDLSHSNTEVFRHNII